MIGNCDCCGYETEVTEYESGMPRVKGNLCRVCAATELGNFGYFYLDDNYKIARSLGYITNMLLDAIKERRP